MPQSNEVRATVEYNNVLRFVRDSMVEFSKLLAETLQRVTPKDTTYASYGWLIARTAEPRGEPFRGDVPRQISEFTFGLSDVENYQLDQGNIYVYNSVFYLEFINEGIAGNHRYVPEPGVEWVQKTVRRVAEDFATTTQGRARIIT